MKSGRRKQVKDEREARLKYWLEEDYERGPWNALELEDGITGKWKEQIA